MKISISACFLIGLLTAACFSLASATDDQLVEKLFANPSFVDAELSPDGRYLAFLAHYEGERSILVYDFENQKINGVNPGMGKDIGSFIWIGPDKIAYSLGRWEVFTEGLLVFSVKTNLSKYVLSPSLTKLIFNGWVNRLPEEEDRFVFTASKRSHSRPKALYLIDADRDSLKRIAPNTGHIYHFITNEHGQPLFALESKDREVAILEWDMEREDWTLSNVLDEDIKPIGLLPGNRFLATSVTNDAGFTGINLLDLQTGKFPNKARYIDGYDMGASGATYSIRNNVDGSLLGVRFNLDKPVNFWFHADIKQVEDLLKTQFENHVLQFLGFNLKSNSAFFIISSDVLPPTIYAFNLSTGKLRITQRQFQNLKDMEFRPMEPVSFESTDGKATIRGYLTKPKGEGPHPTVLVIHGGPHLRDTWGYDPEVQLLALSGYAVLQVNYRGSSGYGKSFGYLTLSETAKLSVEDVIAGARWLIGEGIADPDRMAIIGGSFGGYVSMAAAARAPNLWKAAIGFAGVYDFNRLYKHESRLGFTWVDDAFTDYDEALYKEISPLTHAGEITAPVLLIHGKADSRVDVAQAKDMIRALKEADKSVDSMFIGWGVHGLPEEKDRLKFYRTVMEFLGKHLGTPAE